jgi:carbon-monoxide dehydrogenase small subunit
MTKASSIALTVNGREVALDVAPRTHLADALREELGLTGTHLGCEQGVCGACTIMIDGMPQRGCLTLAKSCQGASVTTIEGFDDDPVMARLRERFSTHHGLQCGYCTPGMLMTARDIVTRLPDADEARIRQELAGNLCRCTGYVGIVKAIEGALADYPADHPMRQKPPTEGSQLEAQPVAPLVQVTEPAERRGLAFAIDRDGDQDRHQLDLDLTPSALWALLTDVETVAACFPGAELATIERSDHPDGPHKLRGHVAVSLGPIKARFAGDGEVRFDSANHRGRLSGRGDDQGSRSRASGAVDFVVAPQRTGSRLTLGISYDVTGPLAQFSRGALVDDLVQTLLQTFGKNIANIAEGGAINTSADLKGTSLLSAVIKRRVGRWLDRLRSLFRQ